MSSSKPLTISKIPTPARFNTYNNPSQVAHVHTMCPSTQEFKVIHDQRPSTSDPAAPKGDPEPYARKATGEYKNASNSGKSAIPGAKSRSEYKSPKNGAQIGCSSPTLVKATSKIPHTGVDIVSKVPIHTSIEINAPSSRSNQSKGKNWARGLFGNHNIVPPGKAIRNMSRNVADHGTPHPGLTLKPMPDHIHPRSAIPIKTSKHDCETVISNPGLPSKGMNDKAKITSTIQINTGKHEGDKVIPPPGFSSGIVKHNKNSKLAVQTNIRNHGGGKAIPPPGLSSNIVKHNMGPTSTVQTKFEKHESDNGIPNPGFTIKPIKDTLTTELSAKMNTMNRKVDSGVSPPGVSLKAAKDTLIPSFQTNTKSENTGKDIPLRESSSKAMIGSTGTKLELEMNTRKKKVNKSTAHLGLLPKTMKDISDKKPVVPANTSEDKVDKRIPYSGLPSRSIKDPNIQAAILVNTGKQKPDKCTTPGSSMDTANTEPVRQSNTSKGKADRYTPPGLWMKAAKEKTNTAAALQLNGRKGNVNNGTLVLGLTFKPMGDKTNLRSAPQTDTSKGKTNIDTQFPLLPSMLLQDKRNMKPALESGTRRRAPLVMGHGSSSETGDAVGTVIIGARNTGTRVSHPHQRQSKDALIPDSVYLTLPHILITKPSTDTIGPVKWIKRPKDYVKPERIAPPPIDKNTLQVPANTFKSGSRPKREKKHRRKSKRDKIISTTSPHGGHDSADMAPKPNANNAVGGMALSQVRLQAASDQPDQERGKITAHVNTVEEAAARLARLKVQIRKRVQDRADRELEVAEALRKAELLAIAEAMKLAAMIRASEPRFSSFTVGDGGGLKKRHVLFLRCWKPHVAVAPCKPVPIECPPSLPQPEQCKCEGEEQVCDGDARVVDERFSTPCEDPECHGECLQLCCDKVGEIMSSMVYPPMIIDEVALAAMCMDDPEEIGGGLRELYQMMEPASGYNPNGPDEPTEPLDPQLHSKTPKIPHNPPAMINIQLRNTMVEKIDIPTPKKGFRTRMKAFIKKVSDKLRA